MFRGRFGARGVLRALASATVLMLPIFAWAQVGSAGNAVRTHTIVNCAFHPTMRGTLVVR